MNIVRYTDIDTFLNFGKVYPSIRLKPCQLHIPLHLDTLDPRKRFFIGRFIEKDLRTYIDHSYKIGDIVQVVCRKRNCTLLESVLVEKVFEPYDQPNFYLLSADNVAAVKYFARPSPNPHFQRSFTSLTIA